MTSAAIAAFLLALNDGPFTHYWHRLVDPTFRGLYQANAFDLAIMLPYFVVMVVLATYGIHRYALGLQLLQEPQECARTAAGNYGVAQGDGPASDLQRALRDRAAGRGRRAIRLPARTCSQIQVLDDSTDETTADRRAIASSDYRDRGVPIEYHPSRQSRRLQGRRAAGRTEIRHRRIRRHLRRGLHSARRFSAPHGALLRSIRSSRWCRRAGATSTATIPRLTEVEAILLDGHFAIEHSSRFRSGLFFNFNGTAGIWRRDAIEDAGGWQHDTLTEDTDLSYRAQIRGWQFLYLPEIDCPSELPVEMNAFKSQQARWAKGLMQTAKKILPRVMRSDVPTAVKAEAFFHLTANISYPLMVFMSMILLPAMIVRFYQGWFQVLVIDLPLFLASTCSISSFYLAAERALYPKTWKRTFLYLALRDGRRASASPCATRSAVIEAIVGKKSEFVRTPKYRVEAGAKRAGDWIKKSYHKRAGWMPYAEVALGLYFAAGVLYAIQNENYATMPFLLLFVWGYLYTGLMSLAQTYLGRLRFGAETSGRSARRLDRHSGILVADHGHPRAPRSKSAGESPAKGRHLLVRSLLLLLAVGSVLEFEVSRRRVFGSRAPNIRRVVRSCARRSMARS